MASVEALAEAINSCKKCPLWQTRTYAVPGTGPADAEIMFVGEAPGPDEDLKGLPFVGRAGRTLRGILIEVGLDVNKVFLTNVVKCIPTNGDYNRRGYLQFREPKPVEINTCNPYLRAQIETVQPKVIIPLGKSAVWEWMPGVNMGDVRGILRNTGDYLLAPTYHPSAVARGNLAYRTLMVQDIRRACAYTGIKITSTKKGGL